MQMKDLVCYLKDNNLKISAMESCTGGAFLSALTNIEGSSYVTDGGYVTYSNKQKIDVGIPEKVINEYGVYSRECAKVMAKTCKNLTDSDMAVGITGTLSNIDSKNLDSHVGKVYYSIIYKDTTITIEINVPITSREAQKEFIIKDILSSISKNIIINQ